MQLYNIKFLTSDFISDALITNRITKKYLDLNEFEDEENDIPTNRKRRRQKTKITTKPESDFENELLKIAKGVENLVPEMNRLSPDYENSSKRVIIPSNEDISSKRKEVVRYVEIPSSFPHFPRLDELYDSNSNLDDKMMEKSHFMLPIRDKNEKVMIDCRFT